MRSPSAGSLRVYSCAITELFSHTDDKELSPLFFKVHWGYASVHRYHPAQKHLPDAPVPAGIDFLL